MAREFHSRIGLISFLLMICVGAVAFDGFAKPPGSYSRKPDNLYLRPSRGNYIDLEILGDQCGYLPIRRADDRFGHQNIIEGFIEVDDSERYRIRVYNNCDDYIGLVISVDGRNIITGERSYLRNSEGMYVLPPGESGTFSGWRASLNEVRRFYFTDISDSYAAGLGDTSKVGLIEAAVFRARQWRERRYFDRFACPSCSEESKAGEKTTTKRSGSISEHEMPYRKSRAGTGYGESSYSPVSQIEFDPEPFPVSSYRIEYRWRSQYYK